MTRSSLTWAAWVGAIIVVATACSGGGEDEPSPKEAQKPTTEPEPEDPCVDDPFGCVEVAANEPIELGLVYGKSGFFRTLGADVRNGALIALQLRKTPGKVLGHKVRFSQEDDGCASGQPSVEAQALSEDASIVAVIGPTCSSVALELATQFSGTGIAMISASTTSPDLTEPSNHPEFFLRTSPNDATQGAVIAGYAYSKLKARRAATVSDGSSYSASLEGTFAAAFEQAGGQIVGRQEAPGSVNLGKIAAKKPDFLYLPVFPETGTGIIAEARDTLANVTLAVSDAMIFPDWIAMVGADKAEGVYASVQSRDIADRRFYEKKFLPAYRDKFGEPQSVFHASAFDAANMLLDALEDVAIETAEGGFLIPRTELRDRLLATSGLKGLTGTLACNQFGDCFHRAGVVVVQGGAFSDPIFSDTFDLDGLE